MEEDYLTTEFLNDLEIFDYDTFVKKRTKEREQRIEVFCSEFDPSAKTRHFDCAICMDTHLEVNSVSLNCKHTFCYSCISTYLQHNKPKNAKLTCALCRAEYTSIEIPDYNNLLSISDIVNSNH